MKIFIDYRVEHGLETKRCFGFSITTLSGTQLYFTKRTEYILEDLTPLCLKEVIKALGNFQEEDLEINVSKEFDPEGSVFGMSEFNGVITHFLVLTRRGFSVKWVIGIDRVLSSLLNDCISFYKEVNDFENEFTINTSGFNHKLDLLLFEKIKIEDLKFCQYIDPIIKTNDEFFHKKFLTLSDYNKIHIFMKETKNMNKKFNSDLNKHIIVRLSKIVSDSDMNILVTRLVDKEFSSLSEIEDWYIKAVQYFGKEVLLYDIISDTFFTLSDSNTNKGEWIIKSIKKLERFSSLSYLSLYENTKEAVKVISKIVMKIK